MINLPAVRPSRPDNPLMMNNNNQPDDDNNNNNNDFSGGNNNDNVPNIVMLMADEDEELNQMINPKLLNENKYTAEDVLLLPDNLEELLSSEQYLPPPSSSMSSSSTSSSSSLLSSLPVTVEESLTPTSIEDAVSDITSTSSTVSIMLTSSKLLSNVNVSESDLIKSTPSLVNDDVVELTGTFLPFELLTAARSNYPYYHRPMNTPPLLLNKFTDTNLPIVEITGTFIPQQSVYSNDTSVLATTMMTNTAIPPMMTSSHKMPLNKANNDRKENQLPSSIQSGIVDAQKMRMDKLLRQATNQTFIIGNKRLSILTGIVMPNELLKNKNTPLTDDNIIGDAFIVACTENRIRSISTTVDQLKHCDTVPIRIQTNERDQRKLQSSGEILSLSLASTGKYLILSTTATRNNVKLAQAEIEFKDNISNTDHQSSTNQNKKQIMYGLGLKNVSKIEVNPDRKYVPISIKDLNPIDIRFATNKPIENVQFIDSPTDSQQQQSTSSLSPTSSMESIKPTVSSIQTLPLMSSAIFNNDKHPQMHTTTVGQIHDRVHRHNDNEKRSRLDSYFPKGNIPQYDPTIVEPEQSSSLSSNNEKKTKEIRATSTIFGFIDFTTLVNGTMLVFTPKTKVEPTESLKPRIQPTKVALFHDYYTSSTPSSSTPNASKDVDNSQMETDHSDEVQPAFTAPNPSNNLQPSKRPTYNEYLVTNSPGITITNDFILPSILSSDKNVPTGNIKIFLNNFQKI